MIRLVRQTMGDNHPTGKRVAEFIRGGHIQLAKKALTDSITGLTSLIEMDSELGYDDISLDTPEETRDGDQSDLDKYRMLLSAIEEGEKGTME